MPPGDSAVTAPAALNFGKFKGTPLAQVPTDYIEFLMSKSDLYDQTRVMLTTELQRRAEAGGADA